jgi:alpha-ketoglutarate-dependent taurine dioxygenase
LSEATAMRTIHFMSGAVADEVRKSLEEHGTAYVLGMEGDDQLLSLAEQFGEVTQPGVGMPDKAHDDRVYSVEVRNSGEGLTDQHGNVIVSSTNLAFSLHTDAYNRATPPRYVLLLRTDDGPDETPTYVSDSLKVLPDLPADIIGTLGLPVFPSANGEVPLLESRDGDRAVRFNEEEIDRWDGQGENRPMNAEARAAVSEFGRRLQEHQEATTITTAGCLVLDNFRICHGRAAMPVDSRRVLKRVWVD